MIYDAIIIGGGHNGLVAACYLAKSGLKTIVLERREVVYIEILPARGIPPLPSRVGGRMPCRLMKDWFTESSLAVHTLPTSRATRPLLYRF